MQALQQWGLEPSTAQCKAADVAIEKQDGVKSRIYSKDDVAEHASKETGIWVTYKVLIVHILSPGREVPCIP